MNTLKPIEILLIEDSPTDVMIAREALELSKVMNRLSVVHDGVQAMAFLRQPPPYADAPRPGLILLDLNLPKRSGQEVLREIKADEDLKSIPTVILTTSKAEADVVRSYGLHANCYIIKPVEFDKMVEVVHQVHHFWFCLVTLPPND